MKGDLFRKEAVEQLLSQESLSENIRITSKGNLFALAGIGLIVAAICVWFLFGTIYESADAAGIVFSQKGVHPIYARAEGRVSEVLVRVGEPISVGQTLAVVPQDQLLRVSQMGDNVDSGKQAQYLRDSLVRSPYNGIVQAVAAPGSYVTTHAPIAHVVELSEAADRRQVICYVPVETASRLSVGTQAQVSVNGFSRENYGFLQGFVSEVSQQVVTDTEIEETLGELSYKKRLAVGNNAVEVRVTLRGNPENADQLAWSRTEGQNVPVGIGTLCHIRFITKDLRPYAYFFGREDGM